MFPQSSLRQVLSRSAGPIGVIGAVGGFIADVLAPLGAVAPTLAGLSLLAALLFGLLLFLESRRRVNIWASNTSTGLFISLSSVLVFSLWSVLFAGGPERGYLADNIEPIAQIQAQLLNIEEDVAAIRTTTAETQAEVETIATAQATGNQEVQAVATAQAEGNQNVEAVATTQSETLGEVEIMATAQAQGFADLQAAFADLQSQNTLVADPQTPQEWYSNARLYQLRGDTVNAIAAYEGYFTFGLDYVDPYLEYVALLKATEGIARTRDIIAAQLAANPASFTLDLVSASLLDDNDQRIARLEGLTSRAPTYGPAFRELALEYLNAWNRGPSAYLVERATATVATLRELESEQNYSRYFIDKSRAIALFDQTLADVATLENPAIADRRDTQIFFCQEEDGADFVIAPPYAVQQLLISVDDPAALRPANISNIERLPLPVGDYILYYQTIDANGVESEVGEYPFTINALAICGYPQPPDFTTGKAAIQFQFKPYFTVNQDTTYIFSYGLDPDALSSDFSWRLSNLDPGDYLLYARGEGMDGTVLEATYPFTIPAP